MIIKIWTEIIIRVIMEKKILYNKIIFSVEL